MRGNAARISWFFLAGCGASLGLLLPALVLAAEEAHGGGGQQYVWEMAIKFIDFAVLSFFLVKFLSKPLSNYLSARAETMRKNLQDLESEKDSGEKAAAVYAEKLRNIEKEIEEIKKAAHQEMEKERKDVLDEAKKASDEIIQHAEQTVKREYAKAKSDLYNEAVSLSVELSESLITKFITEKDHRRLAEEYINKIEYKS